MAVITLARELGSLTDEEQKKLFDSLGMISIDKEKLEQRFHEFGMDSKIIDRYDEKKPGVFSSIFSGERDIYLEVLKTIIFQEAAKGNRIIIGRGANILLKKVPNCLRIRLAASRDTRKKKVSFHESCTWDQADKIIEKSDRNRSGFCRFHYDCDWQDEHLYDLVLNTDVMSIETLAAVINMALRQCEQSENEQKGMQYLQNQALCSLVRYKVVICNRLEIRFFEVESDQGRVTLNGLAISNGIVNRTLSEVREIPGVVEINNQLQVIMPDIPQRLS